MPLRVLVLCGYAENAWMFSRRVAPIVKACPEVEFVFIDPPYLLEAPDLVHGLARINSVDQSAMVTSPEMQPRAWWYPSADWRTCTGVEGAITYIRDFLVKNGPFDGIMGFSSGGAIAALVCGMIEKQGQYPGFPSHPALRHFRFLIGCGSFVIPWELYDMAPQFAQFYPIPDKVSALIVAGKTDIVVREEDSRYLAKHCLNSRMECHTGGHFVPTKPIWRAFFRAYITSFLPGGSNGEYIPGPLSFTPTALALAEKTARREEQVLMVPIKVFSEGDQASNLEEAAAVMVSAKF